MKNLVVPSMLVGFFLVLISFFLFGMDLVVYIHISLIFAVATLFYTVIGEGEQQGKYDESVSYRISLFFFLPWILGQMFSLLFITGAWSWYALAFPIAVLFGALVGGSAGIWLADRGK